MLSREKIGNVWTSVRGNISNILSKSSIPQRSAFVYPTVVFLVAGAGFSLALALSNPALLARFRPAQLAAVGASGEATSTTRGDAPAQSIVAEGEIVPVHELAVETRVSAKILAIDVQNGQAVHVGDILARLDDSGAQSTLINARSTLSSAKAELEKLESTPSAPTSSSEGLTAAYDMGFNTVTTAFTELPSVMEGMNDTLYGFDVSPTHTQQNIDYFSDAVKQSFPDALIYRNRADTDYQAAVPMYRKTKAAYADASRNSAPEILDALMNDTYATLKSVSQSLKSAGTFFSFIEESITNLNREAPEALTNATLRTTDYARIMNGNLEAMQSALDRLKMAKGPGARAVSDTDIAAAKERVAAAEREVNINEAALENYTVRSPVFGAIARVNSAKGSVVAAGSPIVTIVSPQMVARVSLRAEDAQRVRVGMRASVTVAGGRAVEGIVVSVNAAKKSADINIDTDGAPGTQVTVRIAI